LKTALITSLFFVSLICCLPCMAENGEIAIADWERDADGVIWSDYVLGKQSVFSTKHFTLNVLCDSETLKRASLMRDELYSLLEKDISRNAISGITEALGNLLEQYALNGVIPLQSREKSVILRIRITCKSFPDETHGIACHEDEDEKALMPLSEMTTIQPDSHKRPQKKYNRNDDILRNSSADKVNLAEYTLYSDKVDHFRLFLYLWEDNPFEQGNLDIKSPHLSVNHSPTNSAIPHLTIYLEKAEKSSFTIPVSRDSVLQNGRRTVHDIFLSRLATSVLGQITSLSCLISLHPWRIPCCDGVMS